MSSHIRQHHFYVSNDVLTNCHFITSWTKYGQRSRQVKSVKFIQRKTQKNVEFLSKILLLITVLMPVCGEWYSKVTQTVIVEQWNISEFVRNGRLCVVWIVKTARISSHNNVLFRCYIRLSSNYSDTCYFKYNLFGITGQIIRCTTAVHKSFAENIRGK